MNETRFGSNKKYVVGLNEECALFYCNIYIKCNYYTLLKVTRFALFT